MKQVLMVFAMLIAASYFSYDYGVTSTVADNAKTNEKVIVTAETDRVADAAADAATVVASISNTSKRDAELEQLKDQVTGYEKELQLARTTACNLSGNTLASMQQFATANSERKQLEKRTGIFNESSAYKPKVTDNWQSSGNGRTVLYKRWTLLGYCLQPGGSTTSDPFAPGAGTSA